MRRKDRERGREFALEVIRRCEYAALATAGPDGEPYCVPISPVLIGETVYFHCAPEGRKIDNINFHAGVCLSAVSYARVDAEAVTVRYDSAVAGGRCAEVTVPSEKDAALRALCVKYIPQGSEKAARDMESGAAGVRVYRITLDWVTGKSNR